MSSGNKRKFSEISKIHSFSNSYEEQEIKNNMMYGQNTIKQLQLELKQHEDAISQIKLRIKMTECELRILREIDHIQLYKNEITKI
tara:strand:+ start:1151 stop:1408 length:258 start_codon:yes stop_codon:yes gene_type:complete